MAEESSPVVASVAEWAGGLREMVWVEEGVEWC